MKISGNLPSGCIEDITPIVELQPDSRNVQILSCVLKVLPERKITSARTGRHHRLTEIIIADPTATILFSLWDSTVDVQQDDVFLLHNVRVRIYDCSMRLVKTPRSTLTECPDVSFRINTLEDMSKPFAWKSKPEQEMKRTDRTFSGEKAPEEKGYCSWKEF